MNPVYCQLFDLSQENRIVRIKSEHVPVLSTMIRPDSVAFKGVAFEDFTSGLLHRAELDEKTSQDFTNG